MYACIRQQLSFSFFFFLHVFLYSLYLCYQLKSGHKPFSQITPVIVKKTYNTSDSDENITLMIVSDANYIKAPVIVVVHIELPINYAD